MSNERWATHISSLSMLHSVWERRWIDSCVEPRHIRFSMQTLVVCRSLSLSTLFIVRARVRLLSFVSVRQATVVCICYTHTRRKQIELPVLWARARARLRSDGTKANICNYLLAKYFGVVSVKTVFFFDYSSLFPAFLYIRLCSVALATLHRNARDSLSLLKFMFSLFRPFHSNCASRIFYYAFFVVVVVLLLSRGRCAASRALFALSLSCEWCVKCMFMFSCLLCAPERYNISTI